MPRVRFLRHAAQAVIILTAVSSLGCTRTVTKEVKVYKAVELDPPLTTTSTTTTTTAPAIPYNWDPTPAYAPPHARSTAAGPAWIAAAERRWTNILGLYESFILGQVANSQGQRNDCKRDFDTFQVERALFSPVPEGVAIPDAVKDTIELVLGRIESNARICIAGHIGDFGSDRQVKQDQELDQIAKALDAIGADV